MQSLRLRVRWLTGGGLGFALLTGCQTAPVTPKAEIAVPAATTASAPAQGTALARRVLFVGNSYTYYNDLPETLRRLGAGATPPVRFEIASEAPGGASLDQQWAGGEGPAVKRIRGAHWDFVVLQDQSLRPLLGAALLKDAVRKFDPEIHAAGAETVLYLTWARREFPASITNIAAAYESVGQELRARVAPVGWAWARALSGHPELQLHMEDKSHPTPLGSYLAACVFYETLTGRDARGLSKAGVPISDKEARWMQEIAHQTVVELPPPAAASPVK